ncbi:hypothetical protein ACWIUD_01370 [Helicobacter sp. 23-1044]
MGQFVFGYSFAPFSRKTALNEPPSSISLVSRKNGAKQHCKYFDGCFTSFANPTDCNLLTQIILLFL